MKVLVATTATQGIADGDFSFALEGELVHVPIVECCSPESCGCGRSFSGLASSRATTTALVVDRPDLTAGDLSLAVADALARQGWLDDGWTDGNTEVLDTVLDELDRITDHFAPLSIIERTGEQVVLRGMLTEDDLTTVAGRAA